MKKLLTAILLTTAISASPAMAADVTVSASTLRGAIQLFKKTTNQPRKDCDRAGKIWLCSTKKNPKLSDLNTTTPTPVVTPTPTPTPVVSRDNPKLSWKDSYSANGECYVDSTYDHDAGDILVNTPHGQKTVRQVAQALGNGPGAAGNPIYNDVQCGNGPANDHGDEDPDRCPGRVDQGSAGCQTIGPKWNLERAFPTVVAPPPSPSNDNSSPIETGSLYKTGDIINIHSDACHDPNDMHGAVANKMIVDFYGLTPGTDYIAVNGICGTLARSKYLQYSPQLFNQLYGSEGSPQTWLNAYTSEQASANTTANLWRSALDNGHKVYIAEGSPSDFTYAAVKALEASGFSGNYKNIKLIQHAGWNFRKTTTAKLSYVQNKVSIIRVQHGSVFNRTPALKMWDHGDDSLYADVDDSLVNRYATAPVFGPAWQTAFGFAHTRNSFDFNDTVELLWILGLDSNKIQDQYEFADKFLK